MAAPAAAAGRAAAAAAAAAAGAAATAAEAVKGAAAAAALAGPPARRRRSVPVCEGRRPRPAGAPRRATSLPSPPVRTDLVGRGNDEVFGSGDVTVLDEGGAVVLLEARRLARAPVRVHGLHDPAWHGAAGVEGRLRVGDWAEERAAFSPVAAAGDDGLEHAACAGARPE